LGRFPGRDKPVAQALGRAFGKDESWGLPIVGATPINLISGLSPAQAQAIRAALAEVEQAGSRIQIQTVADESCPTVQWPGEARIYGRPISSFVGGTSVSAAPGSAVACPHCGKPILVRLLPAGQPGSQSALISMSPASVPTPVAAPGIPRRTPSTGIPVMTNEPPTPRRPSPPVPIPVPVPQAQRLMPVQQSSAVPDGLEELVPIQDFAPGAVPPSPQPMRLPQAPGKVLPEVPVVDAEPAMPVPVPAPAYHVQDPRMGMGVPVDLEAFEAGLQMGPAPEAPEPTGPPPAHVVPPVRPGARGRGFASGPPPDPDALCSVFIGKSRDPKVHELVAEIQGTSVEEAADLCQRAVVSVVKDIPVSEAEGIKQKLLELKVNPRIAIKR
jgi:hypothetical protein